MKKIYTAALALLMSLPSMKAESETPVIYGNLIWDDTFTSDYDERMGVYTFRAEANPTLTPVFCNANFWASGNGLMTKDEYNFVSEYTWDGETVVQLYTYDTETWALKCRPVDVSTDFCFFDLTQDPVTGKVYGVRSNPDGSGFEFCGVDFSKRKATRIAAIDRIFYAIAADAGGTVYGIADNGKLYTFDKEFGDVTEVGDLGLAAMDRGLVCGADDYQVNRLGSATFDYSTGKLYWAAMIWDTRNIEIISELYCIDVATLETKKVGSMPQRAQVVSLYIPAPEAVADAPAAATGLKAEFEGGSLTGNLVFTAPSTTYAGTPLAGELTYTVTIDKTTYSTGTTTAGAETKVPVTVTTAGEKRYAVSLSNDAGKGAETVIRQWTGYDVPDMTATALLDVVDGQAIISWTAPTRGVHDGYVDFDNLKYTLTRHASAGSPTEIGSVTDGKTTFTYTLPASRSLKYSFGITAINGTQKSPEQKTNAIAYGPAIEVTKAAPYVETFTNKTSFDTYTTFDLNGDASVEDYSDYGFIFYSGQWIHHNAGYAAYNPGNGDADSDDWLLTPALKLQGGHYYRLAFDAWRMSAHFVEALEVSLGTGYRPGNYNCLVETFNPANESENRPESVYIGFRPAADGEYHIGFHVTSPAYRGSVGIDNVTVEETDGLDAIEEIELTETADTQRTFDLRGREVKEQRRMPAGIYIRNNRKFIIR